MLQSPHGESTSELEITEQGISLSVVFKGDTLVRKTELILFEGESSLLSDVEIIEKNTSKINTTWQAINGKNKEVVNEYSLYDLRLSNGNGKTFSLEVRMYDAGFAYRFLFPEGFTDVTDSSRIYFSGDFNFWAYNGENHNVGPVKLSEYGNNIAGNPVTFKTEKGMYFAVHEAAIFDYAPFVLTNTGNNTFLLDQEMSAAGGNHTSWRAFILGETPGDLIESDLLVNLNEPCKIEDPSWIKPGRAMWDWRVWGYTAADGFQYGLNTVSHKRFIDFAAENNVQYLLIDADWYGPEFDDNSDPTSAREGVNIEECMAYAKDKGVGVILYLNDVGANKFGLERILKQFSEWGAAGVKYGFMKGSPKEKVLNTRRIVELCAKYKLMVNFHDNPIAPSGDRRTWPNLITKEFGHSQADAKRSYWPETIVTAPFVNMLAGPLDLCNGWFALNTAFTSNRPKVFAEIPGTVAAEVAKLIVVYGGCFVLPDAPEEYLKKDDLFDCIRNMPAHFDSYKVLDGEIGAFISVARSAGDEWFVGSLTNREGRELKLALDFLDADKKYQATFYEDADETHFQKNKEAYRVRENNIVDKHSIINVKLAPGGGNSIWIRPVDQ
ncbi:glycoside hydrolase family 97 catalytic domain-containing protein [Prolixibacteraceae bacterium Z1-6]|uniref:Glycoside hydrolase family 97 catalytic domain-containing protein n=2 Tax=Draconibacterium aestuarii TaxID=2998507 RepID=A0A9X3FHM3_9BACT|nr:glycoside hydrolase family 97 catalytic domain-containing protein [Prolixibacteraceae bacterium Z1-6]